MAPLPKPVHHTPSPSTLTRLRSVGAVVKAIDGKITIQNASRVPPDLMTEARAKRDDLIAELQDNDPSIIVPCAWCGKLSPPFTLIVNADGWRCADCLPGDPSDEAFEATERAAIISEASGDARAAVPHAMPTAWSDASMEPTIGARCRLCGGNGWWTEAIKPLGWRCSQCHLGSHLPAGRRREVVT